MKIEKNQKIIIFVNIILFLAIMASNSVSATKIGVNQTQAPRNH